MFRRRYSTFDPSPTNAPVAKFRYRAHTPPEILINDKQPRRDINAASLLPYLPPQQQHGFLSAEEQPRRKISFSKKEKSAEKLNHKICENDSKSVEIIARKARSLSTSPINRKKEFNELPLNANNLVIADNCQSHEIKPAIHDDSDILRSSNHVLNATRSKNVHNREETLLHSFGNSLGGNLRNYRKLSYPNHNNNYNKSNNRSILQPLVFDTQTNKSTVKNVKNAVRKTSLDSSLQAHSPVHNALLMRRRSVYSTYNCESHQHPALCVRSHWGVSHRNFMTKNGLELFRKKNGFQREFNFLTQFTKQAPLYFLKEGFVWLLIIV